MRYICFINIRNQNLIRTKMEAKTVRDKAVSRKANKKVKQQAPDNICKTFDESQLKIKIENQIKVLFIRSMSAKHEKSTHYVSKAIKGELPTMRIANRIRADYTEYQKIINALIGIMKNHE